MVLACSRNIGWGSIGFDLFWLRLAAAGLAQNFEHDRTTGRALAFNGLAPIFHCFFDAVGDLFFGFALNAISFGHKNLTIRASCPNGPYKLTNRLPKRNP